MNMSIAYLLIGGNMGNREAYLAAAKERINQECGNILRESSIYETAAWGMQEQESFLNQVIEIETSLSAIQLLHCLLGIEEKLGRRREIKYGPRLIDIDILLFNDDRIKVHGLTVPHPEIQNRRFALVPLCELADQKIHPVFNKSFGQLLEECADELTVQKIS